MLSRLVSGKRSRQPSNDEVGRLVTGMTLNDFGLTAQDVLHWGSTKDKIDEDDLCSEDTEDTLSAAMRAEHLSITSSEEGSYHEPSTDLPVFGPQPWEYTPAPRLTGSLEGVNDLFVLDHLGETVMIPTLFSHRRILVVFLRYFGCRFCRQQVRAIREGIQPALRRCGVEVVFVAVGTPKQIPKFREDTGWDGEVYVDPRPDAPVAYQGFRLCGGQTAKNRMVDESGELLPHIQARLDKIEGFAKLPKHYYTNDDDTPFTGDVFQIGGMFVLERDECIFAHRSAYAGDVPEVRDILEAATGRKADGELSMQVWPTFDGPCDCLGQQEHPMAAQPAPPLPRLVERRGE